MGLRFAMQRRLILLDFYVFQTPGPYAQMSNVSFDFPPIPLLTQYKDVTEEMLCRDGNFSNADCYGAYCACPMVYSMKRGSLVEMIFLDDSSLGDDNHPIHMHGGYFRVVAMEQGNGSLTLDELKARNENGEIEKNFCTAPLKDVLGIPTKGFAVLRMRADNPGYWFMHCHVTVHTEEGMAMVLKVGDDSEMVHPPKGFPTCGNYNITDTSDPSSNRPNRPNRPKPPNHPNRPNRPKPPNHPNHSNHSNEPISQGEPMNTCKARIS